MLKKNDDLFVKTVILDNLEIGGYSDAIRHVAAVIHRNGAHIIDIEVKRASKVSDEHDYVALYVEFCCPIWKYGYIVHEINNFECTTWKHFKNVKLES